MPGLHDDPTASFQGPAEKPACSAASRPAGGPSEASCLRNLAFGNSSRVELVDSLPDACGP